MDLPTMRTNVRRDLHDEDAADQRWSDDELDRHIGHAVLDISQAVPKQEISSGIVIPTPASKDVDISSLTGLILVDAAEYPTLEAPKRFRKFSVWGSTLSLLIDETPTAGAALNVYYSGAHALDQLVTDVWVANTAYVLGNLVIPTSGHETGYQYKCTTAGTSHATTEPTWPTVSGRTVIDSTVVWTCIGGSTLPRYLEDLCAMGAGAYAAVEWASYAINQVNVGGAPTPSEYLKWAQDRQTLFQKDLKRYARASRLKIARLYVE